MTASAVFPRLAIDGTPIACALAGVFAVRAGLRGRRRTRVRDDREPLVAAACTLADAARTSTDAVCSALAVAATTLVPAIDALLIYEERDGVLRCVRVLGARLRHFAGHEVALDDADALAARALVARHHVVPGIASAAAAIPGAFLATPLSIEPGARAVAVFTAVVPCDAAHAPLLVDLARIAAGTYRLAAERDEDRRRAAYDGLTGLLSPRAFRAALADRLERARFNGERRLAVVFLDTDRFKEWNDAFGHASGDVLLRSLADTLREACGPDDLAARNGGDEFCLVFGGSGKADAIERAEAVRKEIAALDLGALVPAPARGRIPRITASIGVAAYPADAPSASALLERADAAMYHSKVNGRDRVSYATAEDAYATLEVAHG